MTRPKWLSGWNIITAALILFFLWRQVPVWLSQREVEEGYLQETWLKNAAGESFTLPDGKPAVLIFWASWCGPCKVEMRHFDWATRLGLDPERVFAVNMGEEQHIALSFWKEADYSYRLAFDPQGTLADSLRVMATPTLAWIEGDGRIKRVSSGLSLLGPLRSVSFLSTDSTSE